MYLISIFSFIPIVFGAVQSPVLPTEFGAIFFGTNARYSPVNMAAIGEIWYSEKLNKGVKIKKRNGESDYLIYDYKENIVHVMTIGEKECLPISIDAYTAEDGPKQIMSKMTTNLKYYETTYSDAGIMADEWKSKNFEITAQFAFDPEWNFPDKYAKNWSHPLFFSIEQKREMTFVTDTYTFMQVFDSVPQDIFTPPKGVTCSGFKGQERDPPVLSKTFRVTTESLDSNNDRDTREVYYDGYAEVIRYDEIKVEEGYTASVIIDNKFGILYIIDLVSDKCMSTVPLDPQTPSTPNEIIYEMFNSSNLHYLGNRSCWQGECEYWVGISNGIMHEILLKHTILNNSGQAEHIYTPIQMISESLDSFSIDNRGPTIMRYYNYEPDYTNWKKFDVTDCYDEKYQLRLQIKLHGNLSEVISVQEFEKKFKLAITERTVTPPMRMHKFRIDKFSDYVLVTFTLLEDPRIAGINGTYENNQAYHYNNKAISNILSNAISGGTFKVAVKNSKGNESIFSGLSMVSDIMSEEKIEGTGLSLAKFQPTLKKKFSIEATDLEIGSMTVDSCAKICDREQSGTCDVFMYCRNTRTCVLSTKSVEERQIVDSTDCDLYEKDFSYDFYVIEATRLPQDPQTDTVFPSLSLNDCMKQCFKGKTKSKNCHSIDYCTDGKIHSCIIHALHIFQISYGDVQFDSSCLHYTRMFITMYEEYPDKSVKDTAKKDIVTVKYNVDAVECARYCSVDIAGCTDFEMCTPFPGTTKRSVCHVLETGTSKLGEKMELVANTECDHFRLKGLQTEFNLNDLNAGKPPEVEAQTKGYGGGEMASVGISMVLVGFFGGFAVVYFYAKRQHTSGNDNSFIMQLIKE